MKKLLAALLLGTALTSSAFAQGATVNLPCTINGVTVTCQATLIITSPPPVAGTLTGLTLSNGTLLSSGVVDVSVAVPTGSTVIANGTVISTIGLVVTPAGASLAPGVVVGLLLTDASGVLGLSSTNAPANVICKAAAGCSPVAADTFSITATPSAGSGG